MNIGSNQPMAIMAVELPVYLANCLINLNDLNEKLCDESISHDGVAL